MEENNLLDFFEDLDIEGEESLPITVSEINKTAKIDEESASELYFKQKAREDRNKSYYI